GLGGPSKSSNNVASDTSRPVAIFSNTAAVGLLAARSTNESIERLTPHRADRASRLMPKSARSVRTRFAMRELMSRSVESGLYCLMDMKSIIVDQKGETS